MIQFLQKSKSVTIRTIYGRSNTVQTEVTPGDFRVALESSPNISNLGYSRISNKEKDTDGALLGHKMIQHEPYTPNTIY